MNKSEKLNQEIKFDAGKLFKDFVKAALGCIVLNRQRSQMCVVNHVACGTSNQ